MSASASTPPDPAKDSRSCASRSRTTPRSRWSARAPASPTAPARWRAATWTPSSMRRGARACPRTSLPRSASTPAPRFSSLASSGSAGLLEQALDVGRGRRPAAAAARRERRLRNSQGDALDQASSRLRRCSGRHGKIVTVFSPKGGTGKTVIATNLAAACAKFEGRKTLLLDLDLQFGDAAIMLGVEPEKTIYDLVVAPGELDTEKLAGYTTKHACGLEVLPAPLRPEDAELVTEAKLGRLLEVARESFDVIVVDTSPFFHGPMLATLDRTDELHAALLARRADPEEPAPRAADARPAVVPEAARPHRPQPLQLQGRHEAERGRRRAGDEGPLRGAVRPGGPACRSTAAIPSCSPRKTRTSRRPSRSMAKELFPAPKEEGKKRRLLPALARS